MHDSGIYKQICVIPNLRGVKSSEKDYTDEKQVKTGRLNLKKKQIKYDELNVMASNSFPL